MYREKLITKQKNMCNISPASMSVMAIKYNKKINKKKNQRIQTIISMIRVGFLNRINNFCICTFMNTSLL